MGTESGGHNPVTNDIPVIKYLRTQKSHKRPHSLYTQVEYVDGIGWVNRREGTPILRTHLIQPTAESVATLFFL